MNLAFNTALANVTLLDEELRAAIGDDLNGVSFDGSQVIVHLAETATPGVINQVEPIVEAHDPMQLTAGQQRLATLRQEKQTPLDLASFADADVLVRSLAQKVAWLEAEIATPQR